MTTFIPPQRMESPRMHVLIIQVDTTNLTALGSDLKTKGQVTINISIHNTQTVIYPRENEEWFITKINEQWVLDKKCGYGNEGLLREAKPGDQVTVTTGDYVLDTGSVEIVGPTTVDGHLTANTDFSVWGNSDLGPVQIYGRLDLIGDLHMNGYDIHTDGGDIRTEGGSIELGGGYFDSKGGYVGTSGGMFDAAGGQIWGGQIVGQQNSFFNKNLQTQTFQVIGTSTFGPTNFYGTADHHGWDLWAGNINGTGLYGNGLQLYGGQINAGNIFVAGCYCNGVDVGGGWVSNCARFQTYGSIMDSNGFYVGSAWLDGNGAGGAWGQFGGVVINGGGITTGWRNVDAGFGAMYAGIYWTNISETRYKRDITPVEASQLDAVLGAPMYYYRYDPDAIHPDTNDAPEKMATPDTPSVNIVDGEPSLHAVDDSVPTDAEVPPEAVDEAADTWRFGPMVEDLPDHVVGETPRGKAPDLGAMVNTAWGAIQELSQKLDEANQKIADLTGRVQYLGG